MTKTLLGTLNAYSAMYKKGNKNVLPAMGRIINKLERDTGRKVIVKNEKYELSKEEETSDD